MIDSSKEYTGTVKHWNSRGFCFVKLDEPDPALGDPFLHARDVKGVVGRIDLVVGTRLRFRLREVPGRAPCAIDAYIVEAGPKMPDPADDFGWR